MKNKIKLPFDEYSVLRYIIKAKFASLQEVSTYVSLQEDKVEKIIYNLLSKEVIKKFEYKLIGELTSSDEINTTLISREKSICQITERELDKYYFESTVSSSQKIRKISKPFLWNLRFNIVKIVRIAFREISILIDTIIMYYKNKCRIKQFGEKEEKAKQKCWAKKILKSKNKQKIILKIKEEGFLKDKAKVIWTKAPLWEILYKGIFIIAKNGKWAIEINSRLPNFERYEFLTLHTPLDTYYYVRDKNEQGLSKT